MSLNTTDLIKAAQPHLVKAFHYELQSHTDYLSMLLKGSTKDLKFTQDVVGKLEMASVDRGFSNGLKLEVTDTTRRIATPAVQSPPMRRRVSASLYSHMAVSLDAAAGKVTSRSVDEYGRAVTPVIMAALKREKLRLNFHGLIAAQFENPILANTDTAGSIVVHPVGQNLLAPKVASGSNFHFPLSIEVFNSLINEISNACEVSVLGDEQTMRNSLTPTNKILLFSNSGWVDFINYNLPRIANRDYFGKEVVQRGVGVVREFQGWKIITMPDNVFLKYATPGATPTFNEIQWASASDTDLTGSDSYIATTANTALSTKEKISSAYTNKKLFQVLAVVTSGLDFKIPAQFNNPMRVFEDQTHSLEKVALCQIGLEAMKLYDKSVFRLFYTSKPGTDASFKVA